MTQKELENYLWGAATLLRGVIDAGDYKQYIFPLLFFKRISDVYDEEYIEALGSSQGDLEFAKFAENHRFQIPEGAHWKDIRECSVNVGSAILNAMQAVEKANDKVLYGIFGDASWTNKQRLSDETLIDLIEHFSSKKLTIANVPDDKLGDGYEYLIKKFADDSGHTAAEFYTNRTVVELMTLIVDPKPGESVYDPTCGSGGLLLNSALKLKQQGKEYRTLRLHGQEINLMTSSIARMNMFLHGIEDFQIVRGDTLADPKFLEADSLKQFDVILANPPYSIKRWNREAFKNDPHGRNIFGTPPQGVADYAFQQHIHASLKEATGRCAVLWPHGILFRDAESEMRKQMILSDTVEAVIGLGPNLFYNSSMEAMILVCRNKKTTERQNKILFIDASKEVDQSRGKATLTQLNIEKIFTAYRTFEDIPHFSKAVSVKEVVDNDYNLGIGLYLPKNTDLSELSVSESLINLKLLSSEVSELHNKLQGAE